MSSIILTIPEIGALAKGGGERAERAASRLGVGAVSDEVAQAGMSSLFARGLLEADGVGEDEFGASQMILAAIGLIADSTSTLRLAVTGDQIGGTSHVHVVGDAGVLITPIGFGCFHLSLLDTSDGVAAIVKTAGESALDSGDRDFLISVRKGEIDTSLVVRRRSESFEVSDSVNGEFMPSTDPWEEVATRLAN